MERILVEPLKQLGCDVWIFGSRATGKHRTYSDLDVLYHAPIALPLNFIGQIQEQLEESNLPIKVDLVALQDLAESYRDRVLAERVVI